MWEKIVINIIMIRVVVHAAFDIFEGRLYTVFHLHRNHRTLTLTWVFEVNMSNYSFSLDSEFSGQFQRALGIFY